MADPAEFSRKIRAIMFSDIKDYSKAMGEDEAAAMRALEAHNSIVVPIIDKHGGSVLKFIGDAVLSSYESASDAVHAAIEIQKALAQYNQDRQAGERILIRVGIHVGDVLLKAGDAFGDGVNIAARLEPLSEPGGICISKNVFDMIRARPGLRMIDLGARKLKNIQEPVRIFKVVTGCEQPDGRGRSVPWARRPLLPAGLLLTLAAGALWHWRPGPRPAAGAADNALLYEVRSTGKAAIDRELAGQSAQILRRRLEALGVRASVEVRADRLIAVAPSFWSKLSAESLLPLLRPAQLQFRLVRENATRPGLGEQLLYEFVLDDQKHIDKRPYVVEKRALLDGAHLRAAQAVIEPHTGQPMVDVEFDEAGARLLKQATTEAINRHLAIILDDNVISAPLIRTPILGGKLSIVGSFTMEEAKDIAGALSSGPLPADLRPAGTSSGAPASRGPRP